MLIAAYLSPLTKRLDVVTSNLEHIKDICESKMVYFGIHMDVDSTNEMSQEQEAFTGEPVQKKLKLMAKRHSKNNEDGFSASLKKEICAYEAMDLENEETTIMFWKKVGTVLPMLARLARIYLSIQASSAESERKFSSAGNFSTIKRSQLSASTLECQTFIHANFNSLKEITKVSIFENDVEDI